MFGYFFYVFVRISFFTPQPENNRPGIAEIKALADNTHSTKSHFLSGNLSPLGFSLSSWFI
jgi:hypothetical protein